MKKKNTFHQLLSTESKNSPKAISEGKISIGGIIIDCAVLEDGSQVIPQKSLLKLMGRAHPGGKPSKQVQALRSGGVNIPIFVAANNLIPFIPSTLTASGAPLIFRPLHGGYAKGYKASIIPDICDTFLEARKDEKTNLTTEQEAIALTLEIITRGLARVGISALVLEACGIATNEKDYLQKILSEYVEKSLLPWAKRFPKSFFDLYKKMYGVGKEKKVPSHIGYFINNFIYNELAPGVLEELRKLNPVTEKGRRNHAHHQFLTENKGVLALEKQLLQVQTIMYMSNSKGQFEENYNKIKEITYG